MEEHLEKHLVEERKDAVKLLFEAFKHLTTLCTGSIVLLATFLKDLPDAGCTKELAVSAVIFLLIALSCSTWVLIITPKVIAEDGLRNEQTKKVFAYPAVIGGLCFFIGILLLGLFVAINLGSF